MNFPNFFWLLIFNLVLLLPESILCMIPFSKAYWDFCYDEPDGPSWKVFRVRVRRTYILPGSGGGSVDTVSSSWFIPLLIFWLVVLPVTESETWMLSSHYCWAAYFSLVFGASDSRCLYIYHRYSSVKDLLLFHYK